MGGRPGSAPAEGGLMTKKDGKRGGAAEGSEFGAERRMAPGHTRGRSAGGGRMTRSQPRSTRS